MTVLFHYWILCLVTGSSEGCRLGDPPPRCIQEPSVVRDRDGRPQEDPLAVHYCCVCVVIMHCWVSRSMKCDFKYFIICSCVLVVLVKLSVLATWLARKAPLMTPISIQGEIISIKPRLKSVCVYYFSFCLFMLLCVSPPGPTRYRPKCESAIKHQPTSQPGDCCREEERSMGGGNLTLGGTPQAVPD